MALLFHVPKHVSPPLQNYPKISPTSSPNHLHLFYPTLPFQANLAMLMLSNLLSPSFVVPVYLLGTNLQMTTKLAHRVIALLLDQVIIRAYLFGLIQSLQLSLLNLHQ